MMITRFTDKIVAAEKKIRNWAGRLNSGETDYTDLVKKVCEVIGEGESDYYNMPSPNKITKLGGTDYQGMLLFVIGNRLWNSDNDNDEATQYWTVKVDYGSCCGCDSLEAAFDYDDQPGDIYKLCLHIAQGMREVE